MPQFLDRLLAVESTETQKHFIQATRRVRARGPRRARCAVEIVDGRAGDRAADKDLDAAQPRSRRVSAFDDLKGAVAETYFATEAGMKELGWNGGITFAPPAVCV